ncbi:SAM-dependent methyltransferase [Sphingoaurantiacus capsulatus]|uniref:SAM-dependent methyltransferase n=1 Tax=Sphingoaurantiacus capsulatus TaxID=1771310 RepID=A0ABV7X8Z3_9SPHN
MSLDALLSSIGERLPIPDFLTRAVIQSFVGRTNRKLAAEGADTAAFAAAMTEQPIAVHTDAANRQHYEVPAELFVQTLGARLKYSSCLFPRPDMTLDEGEVAALAETCVHAKLEDGQEVLELGCGWGSLTLWMAEQYPASRITAVSNSASQRAYIEARAAERGLANVRIITADANVFEPDFAPDRIVSVEMFEHMSNWRALFTRLRGWLKADGLLFAHFFAHRHSPYRFDEGDESDWIAQHFFTGGIMPSETLASHFPDLFTVDEQWWWPGSHYARTARLWLENYDRNIDRITPVLKSTYGKDWRLWLRRWRLFFLATEGLFGHEGGDAWGVVHVRLKPVPIDA